MIKTKLYVLVAFLMNFRSVGVGGCSALARLGAMATPYVAQVLMETSLHSAVTVYGIFAVSACVACLLLPYETRNADIAS